MKGFIHTFAFLRKEVAEVIRQPKLILALVFGPFLILLLFGLGYRNEARPVRTLFVSDNPNSPLAKQIEQYAPTISPQLIYVGITTDQQQAVRRLKNKEVDMVVVIPDNATATIRSNQQAEFLIYHNEIDPAQAGYIEYLGQTYVNEVNRRVLTSAAQQGQSESAQVKDEVQSARKSAAAMKAALQAGNIAEAQAQQRTMQSNISAVTLAVGASVGLLGSVQQDLGAANDPGNDTGLMNLLGDVQNNPANKGQVQQKQDYTAEIQQLDKQEKQLADLESRLSEFNSISPTVLTAPFSTKVRSLSPFTFTPMNFFTPGVIVLLLQHVIITVSSLSIVRERRAGTMELFRVSPLTSGQALIGKYISYMIFGVFIAVVLSLLLAYGLNAPFLGSWGNYAVVTVLLLFAALGIGFFISLVAGTESQAVQFAMIALLLSVFFSGFILDLRYLTGPVKIVSWLLPSTYATILLQDIMLRGNGIIWLYLGGMAAIGVVMFLASWMLMRRQMAHE